MPRTRPANLPPAASRNRPRHNGALDISEEIEPLRKGDDPGLGFIERQPPRLQPPGQPRLDLLGLLPGMTAHDQVISISSERRATASQLPGLSVGEAVADARGLL